MSGSRLPRRRHAAALAVVSAVAATAAASAAWQLVRLVPGALSDGSRGPAGPLLAVACLLAAVVLGRLGAAAIATTACGTAAWFAEARGCGGSARELCARVAVAVSPRVVRPVLASVLAGTVALGTAAAANATSTPGATVTPVSTSRSANTPPTGTDDGFNQLRLPDPGWSSTSAVTTTSVTLPAPTWTPQRPPAPRRDQVEVSAVAAAPSRDREPAPVVVRRGDTLWSIAARHLGAAATDADVAEEWPRWWRTNRAAVGADPDLLLPGQVLAPPAPGGGR